jgi:hypothetical protein
LLVRPPFTLVWSNVPPGRYVLTAVATDNAGELTESKPVEIKVVPRIEPPVVNITATDPEAAEPGALNVPNPAVFKHARAPNGRWSFSTASAAAPKTAWTFIPNRRKFGWRCFGGHCD